MRAACHLVGRGFGTAACWSQQAVSAAPVALRLLSHRVQCQPTPGFPTRRTGARHDAAPALEELRLGIVGGEIRCGLVTDGGLCVVMWEGYMKTKHRVQPSS